jgi:DNA repair exonuclease SbcCD nuclease subunit
VKIAIITDQHFGARKNSKLFHDYFLKFYEDIFFPTLIKEGITTIVDMGDTFDSRKGVDFVSLEWAKNHYYDRLAELGITVHTIIGNHTAYYKNTNDLTGVGLFLREYDNVIIYPEAEEVRIDKTNFLFVPWINPENQNKTFELIEESDSPCVMGHLELNGFMATRGHYMEHGMDANVFDKFDRVFTGHYHMRSNQGNVFYLGNPYEMYWNDVNDRKRGFHLFDTDTLVHTPVNNPYQLFHNLYYEDTPHQMLDITKYNQKIVKVIVRKKSDPKQFEKYIDKLYSSNLAELKIVENFDFTEGEEFEADESEDTISLLNRYIQESEVDLDKSVITEILQDVYREACEVE